VLRDGSFSLFNNPTYAINHLNRIDNENPVGEVRQNIKIRFANYLKFCAKNIFHVSWFLQLFFQLATINSTGKARESFTKELSFCHKL